MNPEFAKNKRASKKKKLECIDGEEVEINEAIIDVFENENEIESLYDKGTKKIDTKALLDGAPMYIAIATKELINGLDLKKEIVMTMLNQLEKVENNFFRVDSILPASIGIRFHKRPLEELAQESNLFRSIFKLAPKPFQGVYRVQTVKLALEMGCKPYNIPRILY